MDNFKIIIENLEKNEDWVDDRSFLLEALMISNAKLFLKVKSDLAVNDISSILSLLREIQENTVYILGLIGNVINLNDFINKSKNFKQIMNQINKQLPEKSKKDLDITNAYLEKIKKFLNDYCHSNFIMVMHLFLERFHVYEVIAFNKLMIRILIMFLEYPYLVFVNKVYSQNLKMPPTINFKQELKNIGTLKYAFNKFPASVMNFLENSQNLDSYYENMKNDIKNLYSDLSNLIKKEDVDNE